MPIYHYSISNYKIGALLGQLEEVPVDFRHYETSFTAEAIYYKADPAGITEVICDNDLGEAKSTAEVKEFLKYLQID